MDDLTVEEIERAAALAEALGIGIPEAQDIVATGSGRGCRVNLA